MIRIFCFLASLCVITLFSGCGLEKIAVRSSVAILDRSVEALEEEPDVKLAADALPANLKMIEGLIKADPGNNHLLLLAARGFGGYAFSFVEEKDPRRAADLYKRGRDYGLDILKEKKRFREALNADVEKFKRSLAVFGKQDVPALFWTGYNWGQWLKLNKDAPSAIMELPRLEILMRRALELDEGYYFGGPHLFFGSYYGSKPKMFGGDPEKSKYHFERAMALSGRRFLMAQYLFAKTYAVRIQDRDLFKTLLTGVLKTPADILPSQRLSNAVAKARAGRLLARINDLF